MITNRALKLSPFITFHIIDNPYNNAQNIFKYKFIVPVHLQINKNGDFMYYSMINKKEYANNKDFLNKNLNELYPKIENLFKNNAINIQTAKIDKHSLAVQYNIPLFLDIQNINYKVLIPDRSIPVNDNSIHYTDIHIPLNIKYDYSMINDGIWNKI